MELAGHKCIGFCEWDKFATASYTSMHLITDEQRQKLAGMSLKERQKEILKDEYRNGECTGCLDVQGRLIYEGDIISNTKGTTFEVEYNAEDGAFIGQRTKNMTYAYLHEIDKPEIIGNVHENQMRM